MPLAPLRCSAPAWLRALFLEGLPAAGTIAMASQGGVARVPAHRSHVGSEAANVECTYLLCFVLKYLLSSSVLLSYLYSL